jgi:transposase-like protein
MAEFGIGESCPVCQADLSHRVRHAFRDGRRVKCTPCGWRGTWRDGTVLERSRLSASQFLFLAVLTRHSDNDRGVSEFLGIDPETVRSWRARILTFTGS